MKLPTPSGTQFLRTTHICTQAWKHAWAHTKQKHQVIFKMQDDLFCLPDRCPSALEMCFCQLLLFFVHGFVTKRERECVCVWSFLFVVLWLRERVCVCVCVSVGGWSFLFVVLWHKYEVCVCVCMYVCLCIYIYRTGKAAGCGKRSVSTERQAEGTSNNSVLFPTWQRRAWRHEKYLWRQAADAEHRTAPSQGPLWFPQLLLSPLHCSPPSSLSLPLCFVTPGYDSLAPSTLLKTPGVCFQVQIGNTSSKFLNSDCHVSPQNLTIFTGF